LGEYHETALALAHDVDLLIHDAQHRAAEFPAKAYLCHSAVEYAYGLAERAGARQLALYHHDPDRTDDQIDETVASFAGREVTVTAAIEGHHLELGPTTSAPR